jgi:DNA (cytosine-5)-methyltransferase 1
LARRRAGRRPSQREGPDPGSWSDTIRVGEPKTASSKRTRVPQSPLTTAFEDRLRKDGALIRVVNMPFNYYNENDAYMAQYLRNLISAGVIAPGFVDERSNEDVKPKDLANFTQHHFFAGVGIWSHALRLAGWRDEWPIWTGSCPCQPFSSSGKRAGFNDKRHLWPAWQWLIDQYRPKAILGEQVTGKGAKAWIDLVQADTQGMGYTFWPAAFPAASIGSPHIRERIYWVADAYEDGCEPWREGRPAARHGEALEPGGSALRLVHAQQQGLEGQPRHGDRGNKPGRQQTEAIGPVAKASAVGRVVDTVRGRREKGLARYAANGLQIQAFRTALRSKSTAFGTASTYGRWGAVDWLLCRDGKWRPVESGTLPLVDGATSRVGRLRAYGNGIVADQAAAFIQSWMGPTLK